MATTSCQPLNDGGGIQRHGQVGLSQTLTPVISIVALGSESNNVQTRSVPLTRAIELWLGVIRNARSKGAAPHRLSLDGFPFEINTSRTNLSCRTDSTSEHPGAFAP